MPFQKAEKRQAKLRLALIGPSGSGKTYTALAIAKGFGGRIALIDTEHQSASLYADLFNFDTLQLSSFHPQSYIAAINEAESAGYDFLIIDSLSHAWAGKDGLLEFVDEEKAKSKNRDGFTAWRKATPLHNQMVETILSANLHLIVTMRSKQEYVVEKDEHGKTAVRKVGMQPVQRDGLEYEFTVTGDLDMENNLIIGKTRCHLLTGKMFPKAGKDFANIMQGWLNTGEPSQLAPKPAPPPTGTHWSDNDTLRANTWKWVLDNGLDEATIHQVLHISSLREYPGTYREFTKAVMDYIRSLPPSADAQQPAATAAQAPAPPVTQTPPADPPASAANGGNGDTPKPPHWLDNRANANVFWATVQKCNLTQSEVLELMSISSLREHTGTFDEALTFVLQHQKLGNEQPDPNADKIITRNRAVEVHKTLRQWLLDAGVPNDLPARYVDDITTRYISALMECDVTKLTEAQAQIFTDAAKTKEPLLFWAAKFLLPLLPELPAKLAKYSPAATENLPIH